MTRRVFTSFVSMSQLKADAHTLLHTHKHIHNQTHTYSSTLVHICRRTHRDPLCWNGNGYEVRPGGCCRGQGRRLEAAVVIAGGCAACCSACCSAAALTATYQNRWGNIWSILILLAQTTQRNGTTTTTTLTTHHRHRHRPRHTHTSTHTPAPLVANSFSIFSLEIEFQSYYKYFSGKCNFNGISPTLSLPTRAFIILTRGDDILQS